MVKKKERQMSGLSWQISCLLCPMELGTAVVGQNQMDLLRPHLSQIHGWTEAQIKDLNYLGGNPTGSIGGYRYKFFTDDSREVGKAEPWVHLNESYSFARAFPNQGTWHIRITTVESRKGLERSLCGLGEVLPFGTGEVPQDQIHSDCLQKADEMGGIKRET
jgi:hypothetical protein